MSAIADGLAVQRLDEGVILKQLDDLCMVHITRRSVDIRQTRQLGEKLIAFIEQAGCRKLVMSFEGVESIYGFLLDPSNKQGDDLRGPEHVAGSCEPVFAGSDLWFG